MRTEGSDRRHLVAKLMRTPILVAPQLSTLRFLAQRGKPGRQVLAACVDDDSGTRYFITAHLIRASSGWWRLQGTTEGPYRPIPGKPDPFLSLGAQSYDGLFWAAGRVQSAAHAVARVRLVWDSGHFLDAILQHEVALFLDDEVPPGLATAEFYDQRNQLVGRAVTLTD